MSTRDPAYRRSWVALAIGIGYVTLVVARLNLPVLASGSFLLWLAALVYPIGGLCSRVSGFADRLDREERLWVDVTVGLIVVGLATMLASVVGGRVTMRVVLYALGATAWLDRYLADRPPQRPAGARPAATTIAVLVASTIHFVLLPAIFPGFDSEGRLRVEGIGADRMYLPFAQEIVRDGGMRENPFYAGEPMVLHHYLVNFLVASYWLTAAVDADVFSTRLMFHFLSGTPLLLGLMAILMRRWSGSMVWTSVLLASIILPITAYPNHGGWAGLEGMNAFWMIGLHADLNYLHGLIVLLLVTLLVDRVTAGEAPTIGNLIGSQVILAAATQVKFNFAIAYGLAAELLLLRAAWRGSVRVWLYGAAAGVGSLALVMSTAVAISRGRLGRAVAFDYGRTATETLFPMLNGNAKDGLGPLVAVLNQVHGPLQPLVIVLGYCLAYTPLFMAVVLHLGVRCRPRWLGGVDGYLIGTSATALFLVLWVVEGGTDGRFHWNISAHLHYVIPVLAALATARLLFDAPRRVWQAAASLAAGVALVGVISLATGARRFAFIAPSVVDDRAIT